MADRRGSGGAAIDNPARFILANTRLIPAASSPDIMLHQAHPGSGLWRLAGPDGRKSATPPYWAYQWAGGSVLVRHIRDHPATVAGLRVLDLGAGSGVVGIAAMKAGAASAMAAEIDPFGSAAIGLNALANGVAVSVVARDITQDEPPPVDLALVGDLFYDADVADKATRFLDRCVAAGIAVLVGDPGRAFLPVSRLRERARYAVADFGEAGDAPPKQSVVYDYGPPAA